MKTNRLWAMLLTICLILTMLPISVMATAGESVKNGYYNQDGKWEEGSLMQELPQGIDSIKKTAVKTKENTYKITLEVITKKTTTETLPGAAATILVIDTSASMNEENRLEAAKAAATKFVEEYAGDIANTGRYLAIVSFSTSVQVTLDWKDVSTEDGKNAAIAAISGLSAAGGTNLHAGLLQADTLLAAPIVSGISKDTKNVIALTDGAPTYYLDSKWGLFYVDKVNIGGTNYYIKGNGSDGSSTINSATAAVATILKEKASVYTVCYGAENDMTYFNGPTVGAYLKKLIATSENYAYAAENADDLAAAFKAITTTITNGLDGAGLSVVDKSVDFVSVSELPEEGITANEDGFIWKLNNPSIHIDGDTSYYTYKLEYTATLNADNPDFNENEWYPLNGETYLILPQENGNDVKVNFPIPAGQGVKSRYTVTWVNYDGTEMEKDENVPYGIMPSYDGATPSKPAAAGIAYSFKGWTPEVSTISGDITYTAVYEAVSAGLLTVSKTVSGGGANQADEFTFSVTLDLVNTAGTTDSAGYADGSYGDMIFKDGKSTFKLKGGESKTASGLPTGIKYTVTETDAAGYTVTVNGNNGTEATGTIAANQPATVAFNNYKAGSGGGGGSHSNGSAVILKVDSKDKNTYLSGARFELYRVKTTSTQLVGSYTTNTSGKITVNGLSAGDYYWHEIGAPEGYTLDNTKHEFTVKNNKTTTVTVENTKTDIPPVLSTDHYAYIIGYPDGRVHTEAEITRAEVATIFFRLLSDDVRNSNLTKINEFSDVKSGDWFNTAVSTMTKMGILNGYPNGKFGPSDPITRAEFATIAARFDKKGNAAGNSFSDIYDHWAKKEILIAVNNGWVLGYEDGAFRPNQAITRAEAMAMVNRVLQRIPESKDDLLSNMIQWPDNMDTNKWYYLTVQEATNSHFYKRKANGYEYWTELREVRDWAALEH